VVPGSGSSKLTVEGEADKRRGRLGSLTKSIAVCINEDGICDVGRCGKAVVIGVVAVAVAVVAPGNGTIDDTKLEATGAESRSGLDSNNASKSTSLGEELLTDCRLDGGRESDCDGEGESSLRSMSPPTAARVR